VFPGGLAETVLASQKVRDDGVGIDYRLFPLLGDRLGNTFRPQLCEDHVPAVMLQEHLAHAVAVRDQLLECLIETDGAEWREVGIRQHCFPFLPSWGAGCGVYCN
jgi:hypothetical protein